MSDFTCIILCALVMSISRVDAGVPLGLGDINAILLDCANKNKVTNDQLRAVVKSQDTTNVNPCFFACLFKKSRFLNGKGDLDVNAGLAYVKQVMPNRPEIAMVENVVKKCESVKNVPVKDGAAGCERAALVVACLVEQKKTLKPK
uniref:OBP2 n=1 Tax=Mythimna loreyi TaxID=667449 RepID=A0AAU6NDC8_9NEOP